MNNLIIQNNESLTIRSDELLLKLNEFRYVAGMNAIRNNDFISRVEDEIDDLSPYETFVKVGQPMKIYTLNQDQCLLIGMRESKVIRKRVLEWIKSLSKPVHQIPQTLSQALMLAANQAEQIEKQEEALKLAAPKVEFVDRFVESTGNKTFREVAKLLKANEREFRAFLVKSQVMYKLNRTWTARAQHLNAKRFSESSGEKNGRVFFECKFTPKGVEYIAGKWISHKGIK